MRDFDAVDAGEDVDAIAGEDGDAGHVGVVEPAKVEHIVVIEERLELFGDDDGGDAIVYEVDGEHGDGGHGWKEEFVTPADVEQVVADAEDHNGLEGENGGKVGCQLKERELCVRWREEWGMQRSVRECF